MSTVKTLTIPEFMAQLKGQGVPIEHAAFRCVMCGTVQSATCLIAAGAGKDFDAVERYLGFSCVGRFTGAGPHKKGSAAGHGCDWTLGGLFHIHALEVIDSDGIAYPRFEPASPEEAQALMKSHPPHGAPQ